MALNGLLCADVPLRTYTLTEQHFVNISHWSYAVYLCVLYNIYFVFIVDYCCTL